MAVLIEACSVVIRLAAVQKIASGLEGLKAFSPVGTLCIDNELVRLGFMSRREAEAYCRRLQIEGLESGLPGPQRDFCIVDQLAGVVGPVNWLETGKITLSGGGAVVAARLKGSTNNTLYSPPEWRYEGSISSQPTFVSEAAVESEMEFLRHDNGVDVYRDRRTGKEVYKSSDGSRRPAKAVPSTPPPSKERAFVSHASQWDMYSGKNSISTLADEEQNALIRLTLSTDGDPQAYAMQRNLKKAEVDGLWALLVWVGLVLEKVGAIANFDARTRRDALLLIDFFQGTALGERLRKAFDSDRSSVARYEWSELTESVVERITSSYPEAPHAAKQLLLRHLRKASTADFFLNDDAGPSPVDVTFREKIADAWLYVVSRATYDERIKQRELLAIKIEYAERVEFELKAALGIDRYTTYLHLQSESLPFLQAFHLLCDMGFERRIAPGALVGILVPAVLLAEDESPARGAMAVLEGCKALAQKAGKHGWTSAR
jgi:hypothetical protein